MDLPSSIHYRASAEFKVTSPYICDTVGETQKYPPRDRCSVNPIVIEMTSNHYEVRQKLMIGQDR